MHKLKDEAVTRETQLLAARKGCKLVSFVGPYMVHQATGEVIMSELAGITQTLMARWLREEHELFIYIEMFPSWQDTLQRYMNPPGYAYAIYRLDGVRESEPTHMARRYPNYEFVMEEALKFALNLLPDIITEPDANI